MSKSLKDFDSLNQAILNEIEKGRIKLHFALEKEKTLSYWKIGKYISLHLQLNSDKLNYGNFVFSKLSKNLNIGIRSLYRSVQFYKSFPDVSIISNHILWSHFKILLTVKSDIDRKKYLNLLLTKYLTAREFFSLVRYNKLNPNSIDDNRLDYSPGVPFVYLIKYIGNKAYLDLGFHTYSDLLNNQINMFDDNTIIQATKKQNKYYLNKVNLDLSVLYTYKANIIKIIDGDTIHVNIDLGFNIRVDEILRFHGIDSFELPSKKGKKAKDFVQSKLKDLNFIVIKTYHKDKYSRYLTDIFYSNTEADILNIINKGNFLNQELLDNELAVKYYIY